MAPAGAYDDVCISVYFGTAAVPMTVKEAQVARLKFGCPVLLGRRNALLVHTSGTLESGGNGESYITDDVTSSRIFSPLKYSSDFVAAACVEDKLVGSVTQRPGKSAFAIKRTESPVSRIGSSPSGTHLTHRTWCPPLQPGVLLVCQEQFDAATPVAELELKCLPIGK